MFTTNNQILTYCTNVHPGESWAEIFDSLQSNLTHIKSGVSKDKLFGIGLRLSDLASRELMEGRKLIEFKHWLVENGMFVFTINGFPYGGFHHQQVKDQVHAPDWTTKERANYTKRLAYILAHLLQDGMEGGISTSPLSYKHWFVSEDDQMDAYENTAQNLIETVKYLIDLRDLTGKLVHIDLEPEPDGLLESTSDVVSFFNTYLLKAANKKIRRQTGTSGYEVAKNFIRVCYDVCHFAVGFENHAEAFKTFKRENIKIGKIQVSAALKVSLSQIPAEREQTKQTLHTFAEPTYLHQVIQKNDDGTITRFPDLPQALDQINDPNAREWRIHFHVPVYKDNYGSVSSTQEDIIEVLKINNKSSFTNHIEVETYTWDVLPGTERLPLLESIIREVEWTKNIIEN